MAVMTSYLDRLLEPLEGEFTPEFARKLVELRADAALTAHIEELREKANTGTLTAEEDAEYKDFVEAVDIIAVDRALDALAKVDPQQAQLVELRFFGGLSVEETAEALGISPATVKRHWAVARAWLWREIEGGRPT